MTVARSLKAGMMTLIFVKIGSIYQWMEFVFYYSDCRVLTITLRRYGKPSLTGTCFRRLNIGALGGGEYVLAQRRLNKILKETGKRNPDGVVEFNRVVV